jgi:hypothetical protein
MRIKSYHNLFRTDVYSDIRNEKQSGARNDPVFDLILIFNDVMNDVL